MTTSTISQNGQTTIPAKVRAFLRVGPKDRIVYQFEGNRIVLEAAIASTDALYGVFKSGRKPPTKAGLLAARKAHYARKYAR
jgi:bifunctional DNA-binding transcriptional regulator/antitoxin component of YhaV-PrlF toxin-antitoxin module